MRVIFAKDTGAEIQAAQARIAAETAFVAALEKEGRIRREADRQISAAGMTAKTATIADLMQFRTTAESLIDATENHQPDKSC